MIARSYFAFLFFYICPCKNDRPVIFMKRENQKSPFPSSPARAWLLPLLSYAGAETTGRNGCGDWTV